MPRFYRRRSYSIRRKRTFNKYIDTLQASITANTQSDNLIYTATVAGTVRGFRLTGSMVANNATTPAGYVAALIVLREGFSSPNPLSLTGSLYTAGS